MGKQFILYQYLEVLRKTPRQVSSIGNRKTFPETRNNPFINFLYTYKDTIYSISLHPSKTVLQTLIDR